MKPSSDALYEIPVFFSAKMVAPDQGPSPSAHKPAAVVSDWEAHRFPLLIIEPPAVTWDQFSLAHSMEFVDDVLELRRENGFGNRSPTVAATLPYTSGSMLAAAREALRNRRVAVAPVSGFHHACYAEAGGFCTFNGLMVAACVLRAEGAVRRVGILDFDLHYGNGTDHIIDALGARWIRHVTAGRTWRKRSQAVQFLEAISEMVAGMADCDLILYQAGADPHVNDPYGGWLTTEQLAERDRRVFAAAAELGIPIAWNLAGGYQRSATGGIEPVLEIHRNTMFACFQTYVEADAPIVRVEELVFDPDNPLCSERCRREPQFSDSTVRVVIQTRSGATKKAIAAFAVKDVRDQGVVGGVAVVCTTPDYPKQFPAAPDPANPCPLALATKLTAIDPGASPDTRTKAEVIGTAHVQDLVAVLVNRGPKTLTDAEVWLEHMDGSGIVAEAKVWHIGTIEPGGRFWATWEIDPRGAISGEWEAVMVARSAGVDPVRLRSAFRVLPRNW